MLIIGSTALKHWYIYDAPREPKDLDVFATTSQITDGVDGDIFKHPDLDDWLERNVWGIRYATPDELYTIKVSHSYWELKNGSWDKHIFDILWLKDQGAQLIPELHDLLYKVWEDTHGKKKVNLNMTSDEFFGDDAVTRIYDHDSIHDSVAYRDVAMYTLLLKEGEEVAIDHRKMWEWPHEDLVLLFREEIAATALERKVIPSNYRCSPGAAWKWALRRTITSLTRGKSAQFIVENFSSFSTPDGYVQRHLSNKEKLIKL